MVDNKFTGMLHAYALGCLNQGDYARLLNYIERGEEYPYQDLGEFQNLVALLPSILENEVPPKSVKESIARQLYYIKDEAKEQKIKSAVPLDLEEEAEPETSSYIEEEETKPVLPRVPDMEVPEPEVLHPDQLLEKYVHEIASVPEEILPETETSEKEEDHLPTVEELESAQLELKEPVEKEPEIVKTEAIPEPVEQKEIKEIPKEVSPAPMVSQTPVPVKDSSDAPPAKKEPQKEEVSEKKQEAPKEEAKPSRSFGDFLAEADIKAEETVGKIEFEDYFAQTKRAEIEKRVSAPSPKPRVQKAESVVKEPSMRNTSAGYRESRNYAKSGSATAVVVSTFLILLTAAVLYYYFNSELKLFKSDNEKMSGELSTLRQFNETSKGILDILSRKDGKTFNLSGGPQNAYSFGKVIYAPAPGKGFIHAGSLPELKETMSYQFWINAGGTNYMIYRFTKATQLEFYPFSIQRINLNQPIRIFLTEEPYTGSDNPSRTVLLSGYN